MITITDLHKRFNSKIVLDGVNLTINDGETLVIVGRSGCGKSVLLKHIVGLMTPDSGTVTIDGKIVESLSEKELFEVRKKFGFLFQGAALFDSMTVEENIGLPIMESGEKYDLKTLREEIAKMLLLVGLPGIEKLKPAELSGGMKKRVGLARALITKPKYIFYDEPTTGLDPIMSDSIDELIKDLSTKLKVTSVVVTHDMFSVKNVADRVAMMHQGKVYFTGKPEELLGSKDEIIYEFIKRTEEFNN